MRAPHRCHTPGTALTTSCSRWVTTSTAGSAGSAARREGRTSCSRRSNRSATSGSRQLTRCSRPRRAMTRATAGEGLSYDSFDGTQWEQLDRSNDARAHRPAHPCRVVRDGRSGRRLEGRQRDDHADGLRRQRLRLAGRTNERQSTRRARDKWSEAGHSSRQSCRTVSRTASRTRSRQTFSRRVVRCPDCERDGSGGYQLPVVDRALPGDPAGFSGQ